MYLRRILGVTRPCFVLSSMTAVIFLTFVLGGAYPVAAMSYSLDILVKEGDTIGGTVINGILANEVSLNNVGDVAFGARLPGGRDGVVIGNTIVVQSGDVIGGQRIGVLVTDPSLNNVGDVAFISTLEGGGKASSRRDSCWYARAILSAEKLSPPFWVSLPN